MQQCCSQSTKDKLGMTLNNAIHYNYTLGIELEELQTNYNALALHTALSSELYIPIAIIINSYINAVSMCYGNDFAI